MSVRVCYLERTARGGMLQGLRLVGPSSDERWPSRAGLGGAGVPMDQTPDVFARGAEWIRGRLQGPRSQETLELLCLDAEGSIFAWINASDPDPGAIAMQARAADTTHDATPGGGGGGGGGGSMVEYFAPSDVESSVQALGVLEMPAARKGVLGLAKRSQAPARAPQRAAVMAVADVPARLLCDALDAHRIEPRSVITIWHALGQAWAPKSAAPASDDPLLQSASHGLTGVVLVDPEGRLVWSWCREGQLLAGGAIRLLRHDREGGAQVGVTRADVGRLASDWMGWSLQVGAAPRRVVCILPEDLAGPDTGIEGALAPGAVCEAIAASCGARRGGLQVDAVAHADPLGATLRALVGTLERSEAPASPTPGEALVDDSSRPNHRHRALYLWATAGLLTLAVGLAIVGWSWHHAATQVREASQGWTENWQELAKQIYPATLSRPPMLRSWEAVEDEIGRLTRSVPDNFVQFRPALSELEAATLVLQVPGVRVEEIKFDANNATISVAADAGPDTVRTFESLAVALNRVAGSSVGTWTYTPGREDTQRKELKATFRGGWTPEAIRAAARQLTRRASAPGEGGAR